MQNKGYYAAQSHSKFQVEGVAPPTILLVTKLG